MSEEDGISEWRQCIDGVELFSLTAIGIVIGILGIVTVITLGVAGRSGSAELILSLPIMIGFAVLCSFFTALPLGMLIGAIISLTGPIDYPRAAIAGALTSSIMIGWIGIPMLNPANAAAYGAACGALALWQVRRMDRRELG